MALLETLRFLSNNDTSSIAYKRFNETPDDRYPTFTICLLSYGPHYLQEIFNNELRTQFGINGQEYNKLLQ